MRILIACEYSGVAREAFAERGHDVWSCDFLETEIPGNHIQDDVLKHLGDGWDMMIAHPPCTYLSNAGLHYLYSGRYTGLNRLERMERVSHAYHFVLELWAAPIEKICIENPPGYLNSHWYAPSQTIQPYYFGELEMKTTCLWLRNLPILMFSEILPKPKPSRVYVRKTGVKAGQVYRGYYHEGKNGHDRSRTFNGIAKAMAKQWG